MQKESRSTTEHKTGCFFFTPFCSYDKIGVQRASIFSSTYAHHPHKRKAHYCLEHGVCCLTAGCQHVTVCSFHRPAAVCLKFLFSLTVKNNIAESSCNPLPSFYLSSLFQLIFTRRAFCTLFSPLVLCHRCTAKSAERAYCWPVTFLFFRYKNLSHSVS